MLRRYGFTLAELLIALAILGVIATFSIPKILSSQQDGRFNAIAKESAAAISGAYQLYAQNNPVTGSFSLTGLVPYLNYIARDTTSQIDAYPGEGAQDCSAWHCYRLANGSIIAFDPGQTLGATDDLAVTYFYVDPDGQYSGTTNGPGKSVAFFIYKNGRITSHIGLTPNSHDVWGTVYPGADPAKDPAWFSW